jgi:hypothetical protein
MLWLSAMLMVGSGAMADEGVVPNVDIEIMGTVQVDATGQNVAPSLKGTFRTKRDAYVYLDSNIGTSGSWQGRLGAGLDMLGKMPVDLTVGGFVGAAGGLGDQSVGVLPEGGAELLVGGEVGRFRGAYRWRIGATRSPLSIFLMENEADVGVRLISTLRLEARYIHSYASEAADGHSLGLGVSYTF